MIIERVNELSQKEEVQDQRLDRLEGLQIDQGTALSHLNNEIKLFYENIVKDMEFLETTFVNQL